MSASEITLNVNDGPACWQGEDDIVHHAYILAPTIFLRCSLVHSNNPFINAVSVANQPVVREQGRVLPAATPVTCMACMSLPNPMED